MHPSELLDGRYRVLRTLGAGGMGEVLLAEDTTLSRRVAIKRLPEGRRLDAAARERILREARAAAALDHPHICPVYEVHAAADPPFIVMQFVEGETLAARLRRGPLPADAVARLGIELADALGAAHAAGVIHRDLKPQNVMLTPASGSRLLDFGLAARSVMAAAAADQSPTISEGSGLAGTPAYMAPEQVQQQPVDGRADLFALGAVLYECLTGRPPFSGASLLQLFTAVVETDPPPPSSLRPGLNPAWDALCARLLAKSPDGRFQSAAAVVTALRELAGSGPLPAAALPRPRPRRILPMAAAILLGIAGAGGGLYYAVRALPPGAPAVAPQAQRWYDLGVSALQEGAFVQAARALTRATDIDPAFALAWARLGEAQLELDQEQTARESLLRASALVPDRSRLPLDDRLALEATMAMVARDYGAALRARRRLAERHPRSAAVLLDLGRVHEAREDIPGAVEQYRRATALDPENPAAFVRLGVLLGRQGQIDEALAAFTRAEALHTAAGRVEGVAEVLYQRAVAFDRADRTEDATQALQQALALAESAGSRYLRAAILLRTSAIAGAQGRYDEAADAARDALEIGRDYEGLTAFGLVDLGNVYLYAGQRDRAEATFEDALQRAQRARARRAEARARLALGALQVSRGDAASAEANATAALEYYRQAGFDNLQRTALTVRAAAQQAAGRLADAQASYESLLAMATERGAPSQIAQQHFQLANVLQARERYVEALDHCERALTAYRALDAPYDVAHSHLQKADLLWRLGRYDEAGREVDAAAGAAAGSTEELRRHGLLIRANAALAQGAPDRALALAREGLAGAPDDDVAPLLHRVAALALARSRRAGQALPHAEAMTRALDDPADALRRDAARLARAEVLLHAGRHGEAFDVAADLAGRFDAGVRCESALFAHIIASRAAAGAGRPADAQAHAARAAEARRLLDERLGDAAAQVFAARRDLQMFEP